MALTSLKIKILKWAAERNLRNSWIALLGVTLFCTSVDSSVYKTHCFCSQKPHMLNTITLWMFGNLHRKYIFIFCSFGGLLPLFILPSKHSQILAISEQMSNLWKQIWRFDESGSVLTTKPSFILLLMWITSRTQTVLQLQWDNSRKEVKHKLSPLWIRISHCMIIKSQWEFRWVQGMQACSVKKTKSFAYSWLWRCRKVANRIVPEKEIITRQGLKRKGKIS